MQLANYILDMGRVVAYYPNLKKVTTSTTATILLCQFLYWTPRTKNDGGWIYKTSSEIEEETGLTYYEQKTAKDKLAELGLLEFEFKRLDHTSRFRVNQEELNRQWQALCESNQINNVDDPVKVEEKKIEQKPPETEKPKKDALDGILESQNYSGYKSELKRKEIKSKVEKAFGINADSIKWERFISFAVVRELKHKEPVDTFINWALQQDGFSVIYWTPDRMRTLYPQAFIDNKPYEKPANERRQIAVEPKYEEEKWMPMPDFVKRRDK